MFEALLEDEAEDLTRALIERAKAGSGVAPGVDHGGFSSTVQAMC